MTKPQSLNQSESSLDTRDERTQKLNPQLAEGELVKVASAMNQVEAEFLQGLLLEEGVPSALRRSPGFDVPGFLAAGPRDVLVPTSGAQAAHDVLGKNAQEPLAQASTAIRRAPRMRASLLIGAALVALIACVVIDLVA
jgi:hypothetical protein